MNRALIANLFTVFYLFVLCATVLWLRNNSRQLHTTAIQYDAAPGCTSTSPASGSAPSCRIITVTVRAKDARIRGPGILRVVEDSGAEYREAVGNLCYERAIVGQRVLAKVWQGEITQFIFPERSFVTADNPDAVWASNAGLDKFDVALFIIFLALILGQWRDNQRTALAERAKVPEK